MKKISKQPIREWDVNIQFYLLEKKVKARTAAEARKKAISQLQRRGLSSLVDKRNTYVEKL